MANIDQETIDEIITKVAEDEEGAVEMLLEAATKTALPQMAPEEDPEENIPTIPDDPDLSHIRYLSMLREALKGRRPDPIVLVAIDAMVRKYGYPLLAKVLVKLARKLKFQISTKDTEVILRKYGKIIVPFMAIVFVDIVRRYQQISKEQQTMQDSRRS